MTAAIADGQSLKATLEAQSPDEFQALKQVGLYYRLARLLRTTGWVNLFWGGLTLWLGLSPISPNFFSTVQAILGVLILSQSLLALIRPGAWNLLVLAILLLLVGLWNISLNLFVTFFGFFMGINILWLLLGISQISWAYRTYMSYKVFSEHPTPKPTRELVQQYNSIWEQISHPTPTLSPELLMMQLAGNRYWWNGLLLTSWVILAHKRQRVLMVVAKPDLIVVPNNPKAIQDDQFAIFAQVGEEAWMGKIYRGSFQQYMQWKGITDPQAELDQRVRRNRFGRKISRGFAILVVIVFLYTMVSTMSMISRLH